MIFSCREPPPRVISDVLRGIEQRYGCRVDVRKLRQEILSKRATKQRRAQFLQTLKDQISERQIESFEKQYGVQSNKKLEDIVIQRAVQVEDVDSNIQRLKKIFHGRIEEGMRLYSDYREQLTLEQFMDLIEKIMLKKQSNMIEILQLKQELYDNRQKIQEILKESSKQCAEFKKQKSQERARTAQSRLQRTQKKIQQLGESSPLTVRAGNNQSLNNSAQGELDVLSTPRAQQDMQLSPNEGQQATSNDEMVIANREQQKTDSDAPQLPLVQTPKDDAAAAVMMMAAESGELTPTLQRSASHQISTAQQPQLQLPDDIAVPSATEESNKNARQVQATLKSFPTEQSPIFQTAQGNQERVRIFSLQQSHQSYSARFTNREARRFLEVQGIQKSVVREKRQNAIDRLMLQSFRTGKHFSDTVECTFRKQVRRRRLLQLMPHSVQESKTLNSNLQEVHLNSLRQQQQVEHEKLAAEQYSLAARPLLRINSVREGHLVVGRISSPEQQNEGSAVEALHANIVFNEKKIVKELRIGTLRRARSQTAVRPMSCLSERHTLQQPMAPHPASSQSKWAQQRHVISDKYAMGERVLQHALIQYSNRAKRAALRNQPQSSLMSTRFIDHFL